MMVNTFLSQFLTIEPERNAYGLCTLIQYGSYEEKNTLRDKKKSRSF